MPRAFRRSEEIRTLGSPKAVIACAELFTAGIPTCAFSPSASYSRTGKYAYLATAVSLGPPLQSMHNWHAATLIRSQPTQQQLCTNRLSLSMRRFTAFGNKENQAMPLKPTTNRPYQFGTPLRSLRFDGSVTSSSKT